MARRVRPRPRPSLAPRFKRGRIPCHIFEQAPHGPPKAVHGAAHAASAQAASPGAHRTPSPRRLLGTPTGRAHAAPRRSRSAPGRAHGARRASSRRSRRCRPRPRASALLGASTGGARGQSRGQSRARRRSAAPRSAVAPPLPQPSRIAARVPALLGARPRTRPTVAQAVGVELGTRPLSSRRAPATARHAQGPRTERHGAACPASGAHPAARSACGLPRLTRPCAHGVGRPLGRAPWRRLEHGTPPPVGARRACRGERRGELKNVSSRFLKRRLPFAARTNRGQRHASHGVPRGPRRRGSRSLGARGGAPPPAPRRWARLHSAFFADAENRAQSPYPRAVFPARAALLPWPGCPRSLPSVRTQAVPPGHAVGRTPRVARPPEHPHAMRRTRRPGASQGLTRTGAKGGSDATGARRCRALLPSLAGDAPRR